MSRGAVTNVWALMEANPGSSNPDTTIFEDYVDARDAFEERIDKLDLDARSEEAALENEYYHLGEDDGVWIEEVKFHAGSTSPR